MIVFQCCSLKITNPQFAPNLQNKHKELNCCYDQTRIFFKCITLHRLLATHIPHRMLWRTLTRLEQRRIIYIKGYGNQNRLKTKGFGLSRTELKLVFEWSHHFLSFSCRYRFIYNKEKYFCQNWSTWFVKSQQNFANERYRQTEIEIYRQQWQI